MSRELGYLVTSIFLCGYVVGPLLWGPGSELYGRRIIFRISLACYSLLHLGQALAHNMETLLVTRFLCGVFACAPLTISGGLIVEQRDDIPTSDHGTHAPEIMPWGGGTLGCRVGSGVGWRRAGTGRA